MTNGIAHVSYRGGSLFLPARTPYDRQILMEYVADGTRAATHLQVLLNDRRWMVWRGDATTSCTHCGGAQPCCATDDGRTPYCLRCAFGSEVTAGDISRTRSAALRQQVA